MFWISLAAAAYVLIGVGFYFCGFSFFKKLNERLPRFGRGERNNRQATSASLFEHPRSQLLVVFFKGLGIFLVLAGVAFFLVMRSVTAPRP